MSLVFSASMKEIVLSYGSLLGLRQVTFVTLSFMSIILTGEFLSAILKGEVTRCHLLFTNLKIFFR